LQKQAMAARAKAYARQAQAADRSAVSRRSKRGGPPRGSAGRANADTVTAGRDGGMDIGEKLSSGAMEWGRATESIQRAQEQRSRVRSAPRFLVHGTPRRCRASVVQTAPALRHESLLRIIKRVHSRVYDQAREYAARVPKPKARARQTDRPAKSVRYHTFLHGRCAYAVLMIMCLAVKRLHYNRLFE
jgi:hypothetical protein